jgi:rubrerythrin
MILKDYQCQDCGEISEHFVRTPPPATTVCPECDGVATKILTISQTAPYDSPWIAGVREVVDKSGRKPWCNEFLRHPTRANLKKWMDGEGLRHRDPGEPFAPKVDREARKARIKREMLKSMKEREAVSIG